MRLVALFLRLMMDRRVPFRWKLLPILGILYVALPWDFLPDLIPFIGWIDDLVILIVSLVIFLGMGPNAILTSKEPKSARRNGPRSESGKIFDGEYRVIDDPDDPPNEPKSDSV